MRAVNLAEKLSHFTDHWSPRVVADYNGDDVMVARLAGSYHWHAHPDTDDFFLVIDGVLDIDLRDGAGDRTVTLHPGEVFVVPAGVEHRPRAVSAEVAILLIEPKGTPNTGDPATAAPKPRL